ncbi:hypothetical protein MHYP_G00015730 [Metynnis hypsauchen]
MWHCIQGLSPPTFTRLTSYLRDVVKPANPTTLTKMLLEGNARNWAYTTRLILIDHYEAHIAQEVRALQNGGNDVMAALGVATKWYHKRCSLYPKKHAEGPVRSIETLLRTLGDSADSEETMTPYRKGPPRKKRERGHEHKRETNPVVAYTENHPELLQIELCPNTQKAASSPLIHEPQVEASVKTPALVEVHVENTTSPLSEGTEQDPQLILVDETNETLITKSPGTPIRGTELDRVDYILSPVHPNQSPTRPLNRTA